MTLWMTALAESCGSWVWPGEAGNERKSLGRGVMRSRRGGILGQRREVVGWSDADVDVGWVWLGADGEESKSRVEGCVGRASDQRQMV
jgi:hypothetical protein